MCATESDNISSLLNCDTHIKSHWMILGCRPAPNLKSLSRHHDVNRRFFFAYCLFFSHPSPLCNLHPNCVYAQRDEKNKVKSLCKEIKQQYFPRCWSGVQVMKTTKQKQNTETPNEAQLSRRKSSLLRLSRLSRLSRRVLIGPLAHIHTPCAEWRAGTRAVSTYPPNGC